MNEGAVCTDCWDYARGLFNDGLIGISGAVQIRESYHHANCVRRYDHTQDAMAYLFKNTKGDTMIKFIEAKDKQECVLTFEDVKHNQFFVDHDGDLCQKVAEDEYNVIARLGGTPYAVNVDYVEGTKKIIRLLPMISRIEF